MFDSLRLRKVFKSLFFLFAIIFLAAGCNQKQATIQNQRITEQRQQIQVSQRVDLVDMGDQLFNFYADENKTALDILKSGHQVETKNFPGIGEFVENINGKRADGKKEFWAFYINGQQSQVGASDYKPKNKDKIEWKLEEIKN